MGENGLKQLAILLLGMFGIATLTGCSDASIASWNLSRKSNYFEIPRRVVFYNGITNEYILEVQGYCSLGGGDSSTPNEIWIVCKDGDGYKKHYLGLSDNVTYIVEQLDNAVISANHYKVIFKPSAVIPSLEIK